MSELLLKKAHVVDPSQKIDGRHDVLIKNGKIVRIGKRLNIKAKKVIDLKGKVLTPGLIDMHVHLREPGREDKETIKTCSESAAAGGFTTIVAMPNTEPIADNQTVVEYVNSKAKKEAIVNVEVVGAISHGSDGKALSEMHDLRKSGICAISDDGFDIIDSELMKEAMEYADMLGLPIISHCEDMHFANHWAMNEGFMSTKLGLPGKPAEAEELGIARSVILAEVTGAHFHATHINTTRAAQIVLDAKKRGANVTSDTCPHYYTLDESYLEGYDPNYKMNPPLREIAEVQAIKKHLKNGEIDAITTDHAPHLPIDKMHEFENCENGIVGLETSVGLTMTHLVNPGVISLQRMVELMSANPAKILKLEGKGTLEVGTDADITIIDPEREWTLEASKMKTKGRNTPFDGWGMHGKAIAIVVGGKLIAEDPLKS